MLKVSVHTLFQSILLFLFVAIVPSVTSAGVRALHKTDSSLPYGGRHITIGDVDESKYGGKKGTIQMMKKCPLEWHMRSDESALQQWSVPGWNNPYVIKILSSSTLDSYAECLKKVFGGNIKLVGPKYSGTNWHVTLYQDNAAQAKKELNAYTSDNPKLYWHAYYQEKTDKPVNGLPGSDYHHTRV